MLADDPEHGLGVLGVAAERAHLLRHLRGHAVSLAAHEGGDRRGVVAALVRVVGQTGGHQQRAEVGVAEAQRPVGVAVHLDLLGGVLAEPDDDLLRQEHHVHRVLEGLDVEAAVQRAPEQHEVQRREVAGRVVEEHVLGAGVARVDPRGVRAGVPLVHGGVELQPRVTAQPRRLGDLPQQVPGPVGLHGMTVADGVGLPHLVLEHRLHEGVRHPDRVVRVLEEDGARRPRR